jgi:hypothetical protein
MRSQRNGQGRRGRSRLPMLEGLENRRLLSGDVIVQQVGDRLEIVGDNYGNQIKVYSNGPNQVCVQGENYTTVNGGSGACCFYGIDEIKAKMNGGNDTFRAVGLCLSSDPDDPDELYVDGGAGDDCIELVISTIESDGDVSVKLYGEVWNQLPLLGSTSGNDTIRVSYTNIKANGQGLTMPNPDFEPTEPTSSPTVPVGALAVLEIYGEDVYAGTITGGNDTISLTNSVISATDPIGDATSGVLIRGDQTGSDTRPLLGIARVDEGNDFISVCDTRILADGRVGQASLGIIGDFNVVAAGSGTVGEGNDCISVTGTTLCGTGDADARATSSIDGEINQAVGGTAGVGSGNDSIAVENTDFSATSPGDNECSLVAAGERNVGLGARVGVGNDTISLDCLEMTAACGTSNIVTVRIFGESNDLGETGSGDDCISVTNSNFTSDGGSETAALEIFGDSADTAGCDQVVVRNVKLEAHTLNLVDIDTGGGDDILKVEYSCFGDLSATLGSGNDDVWFNNNTFVQAHLDGGLGHDRLFKSNNHSILTHSNFEEVNG